MPPFIDVKACGAHRPRRPIGPNAIPRVTKTKTMRRPAALLATTLFLLLAACGGGGDAAGGAGGGAGGGRGGRGAQGTPEAGYVVVQAGTVPVVAELAGRTASFETA